MFLTIIRSFFETTYIFHRNFEVCVCWAGISSAAANRVGQNELGCGSKTNSLKFRQSPVHNRSRTADLVTFTGRRRLA